MIVYGVDPGPKQSGLVRLGPNGEVLEARVLSNDELLHYLWTAPEAAGTLVLEQIAAMGMAVGAEVFETCFWSGRFVEAWDGPWDRVTRVQVKVALCGNVRAKDPNIRQALIDRYGGAAAAQRATKGTKKQPRKPAGALAAVTSHCWSALSVAVVWRDRYDLAQRAARKAKEEHETVQ